jgi:uncharacterized protein (TIGR03032 family)
VSRDEALWAHHHAEFRDPDGVVCQWQPSGEIDPQLLRCSVRGKFWDALAEAGQTLIVTREYEHLVIALAISNGKPRISCLRLPHPNGVAVDQTKGRLYIASTRNPNMIFEFAACSDSVRRDGAGKSSSDFLLPVQARYLPGCLYIHDIAVIKGKLFANAVGMNAVVELPFDGGFKTVWWPRCIDGRNGKRLFGKNYLQLNSIAPAEDINSSFFSASAAEPSARRPGHLNFPVDGRGVIFYGRTRQVVAEGLTRPHSARLIGPTLWVDNSGYGEVGRISDGRFEAIARLPGWTRGLGACGNVAFVGTSRVIPRFACYAPGIDIEKSQTGIHALDLKSGRVLGSIIWPRGNQIFGVEFTRGIKTQGFPLSISATKTTGQRNSTQFYFTASTKR